MDHRLDIKTINKKARRRFSIYLEALAGEGGPDETS
jgi:hypothetical protein